MNGTRPLWLLVAAALLGLWLYTDFGLLPTPYDLVLEPEREIPAPGSGTAFSVGDGVWMTARHVVNHCDGIGLVKNRRLVGIVDRVVHHETADLSLLFSHFSARPLPVAPPEQDPQRHERAFLIGYPAGAPGQFLAAQVEYREIERQGLPDGGFPVIVWAEQPAPPAGADYSGMSGGPVIDQNGFAVGVLVGSDNALGRIVATVPASLRDMTDSQAWNRGGAPVPNPLSADPADTGARLREENRVVEVYCHVERR